MVAKFDPKTHDVSGKTSALAGFADANSIPISFFEDIIVTNGRGNCIRAIDASLVGVKDGSGWRKWLILEECLTAAGSIGAIAEAWHAFRRETGPVI